MRQIRYKDLDLEAFVNLLPRDHRARREYYEMREIIVSLLKDTTTRLKRDYPGLRMQDLVKISKARQAVRGIEFALERGWIKK